MPAQICYRCKSDYKVQETDTAGVFVCSGGHCHKDYLLAKKMTASSDSAIGSGSGSGSSLRRPFAPNSLKVPVGPEAFAVGGSCRAVYSADGVEYEAKILDIQKSDEGGVYAHIEYLGYGNTENVWITDLKPSNGPKAIEEQKAAAEGAAKAETEAKVEAEAEKSAKEFSIGSHCRGIFTEDNLEYEGTLKSLETAEDGRKYGVVRFCGYGNEQTIWLDELIPSQGDAVRKQQRKEAAAANGDVQSEATKSDDGPVSKNEAQEWKVGDFCRAIYESDAVEYEAVVEAVHEADGSKYCELKFLGYGNTQTAWFQDLKSSLGAEERKRQEQAAAGEPVAESTPVETAVAAAPDASEIRREAEKAIEAAKAETAAKEAAKAETAAKEAAKAEMSAKEAAKAEVAAKETAKAEAAAKEAAKAEAAAAKEAAKAEAAAKEAAKAEAAAKEAAKAEAAAREAAAHEAARAHEKARLEEVKERESAKREAAAKLWEAQQAAAKEAATLEARAQQQQQRDTLVQDLQAKNRELEKKFSDNQEVAMSNIRQRDERYAALEAKYNSMVAKNAEDMKRLIIKVENYDRQIKTLQQDVQTLKGEKERLVRENADLKDDLDNQNHNHSTQSSTEEFQALPTPSKSAVSLGMGPMMQPMMWPTASGDRQPMMYMVPMPMMMAPAPAPVAGAGGGAVPNGHVPLRRPRADVNGNNDGGRP